MRAKINKRGVVLAAAAAELLCLLCAYRAYSTAHTASAELTHNFAAEHWGDDHTQIACFLTEDSGFGTDMIASVRTQVLGALKTVSIAPEDGKKLCPDAYSAEFGKAEAVSDTDAYSYTNVTVVGGDYFLIHDLTLADGAFFSDNDIMQDGVVIDESLAWAMYGSSDVSGMNMTLNGVPYYISGVVKEPVSKAEKSCYGELPRAYVSYRGAGMLSDEGDGGMQRFSRVTSYECVMPDPVEGYAYTSMKEIMKGYGEDTEVVCCTGRFDAMKRLKAVKKLRKLAVRDSALKLPYWENASRLVEFDASIAYKRALMWLMLPIVTACATGVLLIVKGRRLLRKLVKCVRDKADSAVNKYRWKQYEKNTSAFE